MKIMDQQHQRKARIVQLNVDVISGDDNNLIEVLDTVTDDDDDQGFN